MTGLRPMAATTGVLVGASALACGLLSAPVSAAADSQPIKDPTPQVLFVADVEKVRVIRSTDTVTLRMPARTSITWFSDRPERHTGRTNLRNLVSTWSAVGFDTDPPNAAVVLTDRRGRERIHVVTLTDPQRDGSWIQLTVSPVVEASEAGYSHTHGVKAGRYTRAQLFIDDAATPPCSALVTTATTCLMTTQAVAFRSMESTTVGTVTACGVAESRPIAWQLQANALNVANGRVVHDEFLFANGRQIPGCDAPAIQVVSVFPSVDAQTFTQMTLTNQSYIGGTSTMGPGGVPSNPSWSPILLTYTLSTD